ncbi:MAG: xanthine phosphoribosyltransferase [Pseudomonadota bacterium]
MPHDIAIPWQNIHIAAKLLARKLKTTGKKWDRIIAVTRGGLVPACLVARDLDIRIIDTISVASYAHQDQSAAKILKLPDSASDGTGCLVVDDLSDTGNTFKTIRDLLPHATYACLYVKPAGKPQADVFASEYPQDSWIYFPWEDQDFPPHIMDQIGGHLKNDEE